MACGGNGDKEGVVQGDGRGKPGATESHRALEAKWSQSVESKTEARSWRVWYPGWSNLWPPLGLEGREETATWESGPDLTPKPGWILSRR